MFLNIIVARQAMGGASGSAVRSRDLSMVREIS